MAHSKDYSRKTVEVENVSNPAAGIEKYEVEGYWDDVTGGSWMHAIGNPAALQYAVRSSGDTSIPIDDEVLYGKIDGFGYLVHVTEIKE
jgi:hypothetical protein